MRNDDVYLQLYLVRHAESLGNIDPAFDQTDPPLSEHGVLQAKALGERFRQFKPDIIISSPLLRARLTAEEISKNTNTDIIFRNDIVENNTLYKDGKCTKIFESDEELTLRAKTVLTFLKNTYRNSENVVLVSHGVFIRYLIRTALDAPNKFFSSYNTGITKINFRENDGDKLALQNDISHLIHLDGDKLFWM